MNFDFKKIIEFFECMNLDDKAYFVFKNQDNLKVCVQFNKKTFERYWSIWFEKTEKETIEKISSKDLPNIIKKFKIDEHHFLTEIANLLLLQAAFADEFIRQVTNLFGKESVQKVILDTQYFIDELGKTVESLVKNKNKEERTNKNDKVGLRVIK